MGGGRRLLIWGDWVGIAVPLLRVACGWVAVAVMGGGAVQWSAVAACM